MIPKSKPIRSQKLRDLARGQECTLQIPGVCNHNPETTVLAHLPDESHGIARKSDDLSACFADHECHSVIDGRSRMVDYFDPGELEWYMRRAMVRTWRIAIEAGVIKLG